MQDSALARFRCPSCATKIPNVRSLQTKHIAMISRRYGEERGGGGGGGGGGGEAEMDAEIEGRGGMKRRRDAVEEQRRDPGRGGNFELALSGLGNLCLHGLSRSSRGAGGGGSRETIS